MTRPLAGVKVVELAEGIAGPYAAKLLADFGADVVKVEPPGGDRTRHLGPFPGDGADPEQSALFLHLNTNKRSIVATPDDEMIDALIAAADIVIQSEPVPDPNLNSIPSVLARSRIEPMVSLTELMKQAETCGCSSTPQLNQTGELNETIWCRSRWVSSASKAAASSSDAK